MGKVVLSSGGTLNKPRPSPKQHEWPLRQRAPFKATVAPAETLCCCWTSSLGRQHWRVCSLHPHPTCPFLKPLHQLLAKNNLHSTTIFVEETGSDLGAGQGSCLVASTNGRVMHITQLNGECLLHLFSFLDKSSRKNLGQTCHRLLAIFQEPSLWPLLHFQSPSELSKGNFVLGPALRYLTISWHSSRVKVCNVEDWMKNAVQREICSTHEHTVNDFLLQVCKRCPNLLALSLSGCGHVTDEALALLLQSCSCLKTLQLENCVQISDRTLEAAILSADSLQALHVDFCRNITQDGLQRFRKWRPAVTLKAERSAAMMPDKKPDNSWMSERSAKKLLWC